MTTYVPAADRAFKTDSVVGHVIPRAVLYEGHGVQTSIVRMYKGQDLGFHRHDSWVQVFVLSGSLHCSLEDRTCIAGDYYFVEPGDEHREVSLEDDTDVLLVKALPNIQYQVGQEPRTDAG